MRGKQVITSGLATVATIHAAHNIYQSMEKRNARQKAVKEGRLSPDEAKKLKTKAIVKDVASVGIAALGIKSAIEEMKEAREMTQECKVFKQERVLRHEQREKRRQRTIEQGQRPQRAESWAPSRYRDEVDDLGRDDYGPRYYDDNPYGSSRLPAPPIGSGR
jgi:gamma-glutamylcysteine synthetase